MKNDWKPENWRKKELIQMPYYQNEGDLNAVEKELKSFPPLIFAGEARRLKNYLGKVSKGEAFLLQGGDCAESFLEFRANDIRDTLRVIMQMAVILMYSSSKPVVKVGRLAGQFAKPRSSDIEMKDDKELPSYRGDIINNIEFTEQARQPNPNRMIHAYNQASATLNLLRAFTSGGYGDLNRIHQWTLEFLEKTSASKKFNDVACLIDKAIGFMKAVGIEESNDHFRQTDFYTSHEALLLWYEEALTRQDSITGDWYDCSAHFLWIGDRTRQIDGAHVEFLKGVKNPLGLKCGPSLKTDDLLKLIEKLNPDNEAGRLTLISRMGVNKVEEYLPSLIRAVKKEGYNVVWSCDPMHGNTYKSSSGYKTRSFEDILMEVKQFIAVHHAEGTYPGGVHLEMTGNNVTECVGGFEKLGDKSLSERYHTHCDPRLNASQSIELSLLLAEEFTK